MSIQNIDRRCYYCWQSYLQERFCLVEATLFILVAVESFFIPGKVLFPFFLLFFFRSLPCEASSPSRADFLILSTILLIASSLFTLFWD